VYKNKIKSNIFKFFSYIYKWLIIFNVDGYLDKKNELSYKLFDEMLNVTLSKLNKRKNASSQKSWLEFPCFFPLMIPL
jgi:hypothetical protein